MGRLPSYAHIPGSTFCFSIAKEKAEALQLWRELPFFVVIVAELEQVRLAYGRVHRSALRTGG